MPKALTAQLRSGSTARGRAGTGGGAEIPWGSGRDGRVFGGYSAPVALTNDEGSSVVVGGDDGVMLPLGVAGTVAGGPAVAVPEGPVPTELELSIALSVVIGAVGVVGADPVGLVLGGGVGDGVVVGEEKPVVGRGTGPGVGRGPARVAAGPGLRRARRPPVRSPRPSARRGPGGGRALPS